MLASKIRKTLALLLSLTMCVSLLGTAASAVGAGGELICGKEEHTHSESCYAEELTCGLEESAGHQHTDTCYGLTCGQAESEGHTHTDACYEEGELICDQEEIAGHTHTDACSGLICGLEVAEPHTHDTSCYTEQLVCGKEEHTHDASCYAAEEPEEDVLTVQSLLDDPTIDQDKTKVMVVMYYYDYNSETGELDTSKKTELAFGSKTLAKIAAGGDYALGFGSWTTREKDQYATRYLNTPAFWFKNQPDDATGYLPEYDHMGSLELPEDVPVSIANADLRNMVVTEPRAGAYYVYLYQELRPEEEGPSIDFEATDYDLSIAAISPVNYQPTSAGVTVACTDESIEYDPVTGTFTANLTVTIGSSAPRNINVNLTEALADAMEMVSKAGGNNMVLPGDTIIFNNITIVNESGRTYHFVNGSAQIGTVPYATENPYADAVGF